jgi:hypothetical protein
MSVALILLVHNDYSCSLLRVMNKGRSARGFLASGISENVHAGFNSIEKNNGKITFTPNVLQQGVFNGLVLRPNCRLEVRCQSRKDGSAALLLLSLSPRSTHLSLIHAHSMPSLLFPYLRPWPVCSPRNVLRSSCLVWRAASDPSQLEI